MAAAREGMAAAEAAAEARGQGPGVRVAALPAQSGPPGLPQSLQWVHGRRLGSLGGILVLYAQGERQETLSLPPPPLPAVISGASGSLAKLLHQG